MSTESTLPEVDQLVAWDEGEYLISITKKHKT